jgi:catechol 2,3-dioxygenase-like lactoylglutathione lyase family enzyme
VLKRIDHVGIVVDSLDEACGLLESLGLRRDRVLNIPGRLTACFYACGDIDIEVMEITEPAERARRLRSERARIEHIAIEVDSITVVAQQLAKLGVKTQTESPVKLDGGLNYWTDAETSAGVVYQLIEPSP